MNVFGTIKFSILVVLALNSFFKNRQYSKYFFLKMQIQGSGTDYCSLNSQIYSTLLIDLF